MNNEQLAAMIIGVAVTTVIVGAVVIVLMVLRSTRRNRVGSGLFPAFEDAHEDQRRESRGRINAPEPAPYRVVEWKQPGVPEQPPAPQPQPVAQETTADEVVVVRAEQPSEIRLDDADREAIRQASEDASDASDAAAEDARRSGA